MMGLEPAQVAEEAKAASRARAAIMALSSLRSTREHDADGEKPIDRGATVLAHTAHRAVGSVCEVAGVHAHACGGNACAHLPRNNQQTCAVHTLTSSTHGPRDGRRCPPTVLWPGPDTLTRRSHTDTRRAPAVLGADHPRPSHLFSRWYQCSVSIVQADFKNSVSRRTKGLPTDQNVCHRCVSAHGVTRCT